MVVMVAAFSPELAAAVAPEVAAILVAMVELQSSVALREPVRVVFMVVGVVQAALVVLVRVAQCVLFGPALLAHFHQQTLAHLNFKKP
jgi:hypothetical protein